VAKLLPAYLVAKAFDTVYWFDPRDKAHRSPVRLAMPFAADDTDAAQVMEQLASDAGFDSIRVGSL
jgi:predicted dinucleotide-binding enzyme